MSMGEAYFLLQHHCQQMQQQSRRKRLGCHGNPIPDHSLAIGKKITIILFPPSHTHWLDWEDLGNSEDSLHSATA